MKRILREAADHLRVCGGIGAKQWGQPLRNNPATREGMREGDRRKGISVAHDQRKRREPEPKCV